MNSFERVSAAVRFQTTDRVPVIAQVFGHAAVRAGVPLGDYVRNGDLLARCQLQALEHYGYDAVFGLMDVSVETEAVGSALDYRTDQYPVIRSYALADGADPGQLEIPNPAHDGRMPELLRALRVLRQELGDTVVVVGCVVGPLTLATQLVGLEPALYLAIDSPDEFTRLLDFATEVVIRFGTAQLAAGAHLPVVFEPSASPDVVPPQFYREFVLPRLARVFAALREAGAIANWLHTAGQAGPILHYYPQAGVNLANFDCCVDPLASMQSLPQTCLSGNLGTLSFIESEPAEIRRQSSRLLDLFAGRGGFVLSSGCEIPPESRPENIAAMVRAAREEG